MHGPDQRQGQSERNPAAENRQPQHVKERCIHSVQYEVEPMVSGRTSLVPQDRVIEQVGQRGQRPIQPVTGLGVPILAAPNQVQVFRSNRLDPRVANDQPNVIENEGGSKRIGVGQQNCDPQGGERNEVRPQVPARKSRRCSTRCLRGFRLDANSPIGAHHWTATGTLRLTCPPDFRARDNDKPGGVDAAIATFTWYTPGYPCAKPANCVGISCPFRTAVTGVVVTDCCPERVTAPKPVA